MAAHQAPHIVTSAQAPSCQHNDSLCAAQVCLTPLCLSIIQPSTPRVSPRVSGVAQALQLRHDHLSAAHCDEACAAHRNVVHGCKLLQCHTPRLQRLQASATGAAVRRMKGSRVRTRLNSRHALLQPEASHGRPILALPGVRQGNMVTVTLAPLQSCACCVTLTDLGVVAQA